MLGNPASMYESFFGFRDTPFRLSADEKFRYAHKNYLRASAYLAYALQQSEGFVMITGQPGSGKTTLVKDVMSEIDDTKFQVLNLVTSQLQAEELLRKVALEYGLPAETYNKATLLTSIHKHISALHEKGKRSILFLDEAQNLSLNGLEELRLLSNLQQGKYSLLQIVLIGHDELRELVLGPGMEHIRQRLIATCQIKSMFAEQTREYIMHRLNVAGWQGDPSIEEDVFRLIHQVAQGVPRKINHLMSRLLLFASLEEKHELTDEDALTVIEELVDEHRITLVDGEAYEAFAQRYREEKQQRLEERSSAGRQDMEYETQEESSLQKDQSGNGDRDKKHELIASTHLITENLLSVIDESVQEHEDTWEIPDDWYNRECDLSAKKEPVPTPSSEDHTTIHDEAPRIDEENEPASRNGPGSITLPSADEIWNDDIDAVAMDSIFTDSARGQKTPSAESLNLPGAAKSSSIQDEPRWGGVWWMSSEHKEEATDHRGRVIGSEKSADKTPPVPNAKTKNAISVDENLSMPSVWVESCPDVIMPQHVSAHAAKRGAEKRHGLNHVIYHAIFPVTVGLLVFLAALLFPNRINIFWQGIMASVSGEEEQASQVHEEEAVVVGAVESGVRMDVASWIVPQQPIAESAHDVTPEPGVEEVLTDVPLQIGSSDVSSFKNIEMATRYSVYFDFNKSAIPTQYIPLLKSVQYKMLLEENSFLRITGYADAQGNNDYNYRLSLRRAEEVKQFFSLRGIAGDRLHVDAVGAVGVDSQSGLESDDAESERRRVEVILFPN